MTKQVFISYSWDDEAHKIWVRTLAHRLRSKSGIESLLDQWHLVPGDRLPLFMEHAVRDSDFVLLICTPNYRERSDSRRGGVGYEGDVMTAEVLTNQNHRKFIPLLRVGDWPSAAPSWLRGKVYLDFRRTPPDDLPYKELVTTILGTRPQAPPVELAEALEADSRQISNALQTLGTGNGRARRRAIAHLATGVHDATVRRTLIGLLRDPNGRVRSSAIAALASAADLDDVQAALLESLQDPSHMVRGRAAAMLARAAERPDIQAVLLQYIAAQDHASHPRSRDFRRNVIGGLAILARNPDVRGTLMNLLQRDKDPWVRATIIRHFARVIDEPSVRSAVVESLQDENPIIRESALEVLAPAVAFDDAIRSAVIGCLEPNRGPQMRAAAIPILARVVAQYDDVSAALLTAVIDPGPSAIRLSAVHALGRAVVRDNVRVVLLRRLEEDEDAEVRRAAIDALFRAANRLDVRGALLRRLRDVREDPEVRRAARRALEAHS